MIIKKNSGLGSTRMWTKREYYYFYRCYKGFGMSRCRASGLGGALDEKTSLGSNACAEFIPVLLVYQCCVDSAL